jgi:hypothetical protein
MAFTYICFYSVDVAEMAWTGIFLEVLEPYILKDMLGSLPPEVSNTRIHDCYHTSENEHAIISKLICRLCKH